MKHFFMVLLVIIVSVSCAKNDACDAVACINGFCENGDCNCDLGYAGEDCSEKKLPSCILITSIKVTKFPATDDSGGNWDAADGPDLSFSIEGFYNPFTASLIYLHGDAYENAIPGNTYSFIPEEALKLTFPTLVHRFTLFDVDTPDPDRSMGHVDFTPYFHENEGFPGVLIVNPALGEIWVEFAITYEFD